MSAAPVEDAFNDESNATAGKRSLTKCQVLLDFNKYADHANVEPSFDDLQSRLNAYLVVDALLISLLVTLLPIPRSDLQTAFAWTSEDLAYWDSSVWSIFGPLSDADVALDNAIRTWVMSTCLLLSSFCFSLFTYVQLLGVNKAFLKAWYHYFKHALLLCMWTLITGLIVFFWSCAYWIQLLGGAKGLDIFISGFVGTSIPVAIFGVLSPVVNAFINARVFKGNQQ